MLKRPTDQRKAPLARPDELARRCKNLLDFWKTAPVSAITAVTISEYTERRAVEAGPHVARRELQDLSAAIGYAIAHERLTADKRPVITINLPQEPAPRERWLTVSEAAKLVRTAWRYRQPQNGARTERKARQHVARFILVALYTGSRAGAVCGAAMGPAIDRGYVDTAAGIFYRRPPSTRDGNKKRPPVNLPGQLLAHIRRWERLGIARQAVVEYDGAPVASVKKAFAATVRDSGLEGKVTPHTLRHTMITWALREGEQPSDVSLYAGVSERIIRKHYAHHIIAAHESVGEAITRGRGQRERNRNGTRVRTRVEA